MTTTTTTQRKPKRGDRYMRRAMLFRVDEVRELANGRYALYVSRIHRKKGFALGSVRYSEWGPTTPESMIKWVG